MRALVVLSLPFLLGGCFGDAVAHTGFTVSAASAGVTRQTVERKTDEIVRVVAQANGLVALKPQNEGSPSEKTYYGSSGNPVQISFGAKFGRVPVMIHIDEYFIAHPTEKHRKIVSELTQRLAQAGLEVKKLKAEEELRLRAERGEN